MTWKIILTRLPSRSQTDMGGAKQSVATGYVDELASFGAAGDIRTVKYQRKQTVGDLIYLYYSAISLKRHIINPFLRQILLNA